MGSGRTKTKFRVDGRERGCVREVQRRNLREQDELGEQESSLTPNSHSTVAVRLLLFPLF